MRERREERGAAGRLEALEEAVAALREVRVEEGVAPASDALEKAQEALALAEGVGERIGLLEKRLALKGVK